MLLHLYISFLKLSIIGMVSANIITTTTTTMAVVAVTMIMAPVLSHSMAPIHHPHALVVIALDLLPVAVEVAVVVTISTIAVNTVNLSLRLT